MTIPPELEQPILDCWSVCDDIEVNKEHLMYNIAHRPITKVQSVIDSYTKRDGVPVTYVCTTSTKFGVTFGDVFYRDTPHPEFGNNYFIIAVDKTTRSTKQPLYIIASADWVEDLSFGMIKVAGQYHYSRGRHDYFSVGGYIIDGGRAYVRRGGAGVPPVLSLKVKDGNFVEELKETTDD